MKVVFVNRYFFPDESATSRMVSTLAFALARRSLPVTALCSRGRRDGEVGALAPTERVDGVEIVRLAGTRLDRGGLAGRAIDYLAFHVTAAGWLAANLRRGDVCVVCTDPPLQSVSAALPIAARRAQLVNWVMDLFPETAIELGVLGRNGLAARLTLALRDRSLHAAARVVCLTDPMRDHLAARGVPADRLVVMRHWSDGEQIRVVDPANNSLRQMWGLKDKFVVGYSGNFGRAHEFATLLDAADLLRHDDNTRFLMIGDGARRPWVEQEARRRGLTNLVFHPLQPPERISESLGAADVHLISLLPQLEHCIVPSKFFGVLAAGRATLFVGALDGEVARLATAAGCGEAVAVGDGAGLAGRIRALRRDAERRLAMGERARRLLVSDFQKDNAVAAWLGLLAELQSEGWAPGADGLTVGELET